MFTAYWWVSVLPKFQSEFPSSQLEQQIQGLTLFDTVILFDTALGISKPDVVLWCNPWA